MSSHQPDADLAALWAEVDHLLRQGQPAQAETVLREIRARAEALHAAGGPAGIGHLADAGFMQGVVLAMAGRPAEAAWREALPFAEQALAASPGPRWRDRLAALHYNLGNEYVRAGRQAEAEAAFRAALPLFEANAQEVGSPYCRNCLAQARFNLGNSCAAAGRAAEAERLFLSARELWQRLTEEEPLTVAHAHNLARSYFNFAHARGAQGPHPEAVAAYRHARDIWQRLLAQHGEDVEQLCDLARCCHNLSIMLSLLGEHEEAVAAIEAGLPHFHRLTELEPGNGYFADLLRGAQEQLDRLRGNDPARIVAEQLAAGARAAAQARQAGDWQRLRHIAVEHLTPARDYCQANRPVEMEQMYRAATALLAEAAAHDPSPDTAHLEAAVWFDLNIDLRSLGRYDGAEEAVRTALERWQRLAGLHPGDPRFRHWLAGAHNNLGIICADTGRPGPAERSYRTALALRDQAARADPANADNQLFLGGALCNLGNVYLGRGDLATARGLYERAIATIEAVRDRLPGNQLVEQFLTNSRDGLRETQNRPAHEPDRFQAATIAWSAPGPPALDFAPADPQAAQLRQADELRLAGRHDDALQATAELVALAPGSADAWLLRGLVLGHFLTEQGGERVSWQDDRHDEATEAFYRVLVLRPGDYRALLYKGLALRMAAHAAQAHLRAMLGATEKLAPAERDAYLRPARTRYDWTVRRAAESLERAARLRPADGQPWYELAVLYHGLGLDEQARAPLERLRSVDSELWQKVRMDFERGNG